MVSQSDYFIQIVDINSHTEWQTVQIQISWLLQKPADLDLQWLQRQGILELSRTSVNIFVMIYTASRLFDDVLNSFDVSVLNYDKKVNKFHAFQRTCKGGVFSNSSAVDCDALHAEGQE